jgi:choline dehydrogenase-like flavoprotein
MADYVVIGAGSAGCVLAGRLTEDPDVRVLLLEAGPPDRSVNIHVPLGFTRNFRTEVDWDLATHPEPELQRRRIYLPRGRTLGGSSSINAMIYVRGNPRRLRRLGADRLRRVGLRRPAPVLQARRGQRARRDRDLLRHIRATAQTLYHPVGTCAIGRVVDSQLRVLGVEGLRVVDASVMPQIPRGNTNAPVIAIAERAAELVRGASAV